MSSTTDKLKGLANEAVGNVKQAAGKATGNDRLVAEGKAQELKGEAQKTGARSRTAPSPSRQDHRPLSETGRRGHVRRRPFPHRRQEVSMNRDQIRGASRHLRVARRPPSAADRRPGPPGARGRQQGGRRRPIRLRRARDRAEDLIDDGRHLAHDLAMRHGRGPTTDRRRPALRRRRLAAGLEPTAGRRSGTPTAIAPTPCWASQCWPSPPAGSSAAPADRGDRVRACPVARGPGPATPVSHPRGPDDMVTGLRRILTAMLLGVFVSLG